MSLRSRLAAITIVVVLAIVIGVLVVSRVVRPRGAGVATPATTSATGTVSAPIAGAPEIRTHTVTIYQRADTDELALAGVPGQVVWFNSPVDRARQIVQLVLEGVPGEQGAVPPVPPGVRYRDVSIASTGIAWIDLEGASLGEVAGSDEEEALVGALARSLTEALPEVQRAGVLVDGQPVRTLTGHVDLYRTYTGREWPAIGVADEGQAAGDADASGSSAPASAEPGTAASPPATPDTSREGTIL